MKNIIILLSVFLFLFVAGVSHAKKNKKPPDDADYILYYDEKGEIIGAELKNKKCKLEELNGMTESEIQKFLKDKYRKYHNMKALAVDVIKFYGNSYCIVYMGGWPVCICCD